MSRAPAPPRPRRQPKRSKVAELEQRLDELSSQFDPSGQPRSQGHVSPPPSARPSTARRDSVPLKRKADSWEPLSFAHLFPERDPTSDNIIGNSHAAGEPPMSPSWSGENEATPRHIRHQSRKAPHDVPWPSLSDSLWPVADEAEVLLKHYHEIYAHMCPFVVISPGQTAADLRRERPFVWKGVMLTILFFDGARNLKLGRELLADIVRVTLLEGTKSLDVLQGLQLVIVG